jgi:hypothetical protein
LALLPSSRKVRLERPPSRRYLERMRNHLRSRVAPVATTLLLLISGCGADETAPSGTGAAAPDTLAPLYQREFLFLGSRGGSPLVAPFAFRAREREGEIERTARAGLAHGDTWDTFFEETWTTSAESGVWRILPHGDLRLAVGGAADVEAFWYRSGDRRLRMEIDEPISEWREQNSLRYRLNSGRLRLGSESTPGIILESLQVQRSGDVDRDSDLLFLSAGDSLRLVLGESLAREGEGIRGFATSWNGGTERSWDQAEVRWLELRAFDEARRDIPLQWSFRIPEAGIHGEVSALGMSPKVGMERPGRRAVEIRYTVEGWIEVGEARSPVMGVVRHIQQ